jgi:hypothetical protein
MIELFEAVLWTGCYIHRYTVHERVEWGGQDLSKILNFKI